jgi:hypothetical protein
MAAKDAALAGPLRKLLDEGAATGQFTIGDSGDAAHAILGAVMITTLTRWEGGRDTQDPEFQRGLTDQLVRGRRLRLNARAVWRTTGVEFFTPMGRRLMRDVDGLVTIDTPVRFVTATVRRSLDARPPARRSRLLAARSHRVEILSTRKTDTKP